MTGTIVLSSLILSGAVFGWLVLDFAKLRTWWTLRHVRACNRGDHSTIDSPYVYEVCRHCGVVTDEDFGIG